MVHSVQETRKPSTAFSWDKRTWCKRIHWKKQELKCESILGRCFWERNQLSLRPHPPYIKLLVFASAQKESSLLASSTLHLGWCDATCFQSILATGKKAAAGDDTRVRGDGEEGGAGRGGAVHHQGGRCQVEGDWRHQVTHHLFAIGRDLPCTYNANDFAGIIIYISFYVQ